VKAAVEKTFPGASVKGCHPETEDGKAIYEVKLKTKDGRKVQMDVDPAGLVMQTGEVIILDAAPPTVVKTFKNTYKEAKVVTTEKWMMPGGKVNYRINYLMADGSKKTVIYSDEGVFVKETVYVDTDVEAP
jgi:hypothetical protein